MLEVYPHAALVATFDLPVSLKYKRGGVAQKRAGLRQLSGLLGRLCIGPAPIRAGSAATPLLSRDVAVLRGQALKAHEDTLDAVVCAYVAACWARRHTEGIDVFGDAASGYIVNPRLRAAEHTARASGDPGAV
jgi:predicted RNase H-like nuclease